MWSYVPTAVRATPLTQPKTAFLYGHSGSAQMLGRTPLTQKKTWLLGTGHYAKDHFSTGSKFTSGQYLKVDFNGIAGRRQ